MFCSNCGEKVPLSAKFCSHCGTKTEASQSEETCDHGQQMKTDANEGSRLNEVDDFVMEKVKTDANEGSKLNELDDFVMEKAAPTKRTHSSEAVVMAVNSLKRMFNGCKKTSPTHTVDFNLHSIDRKALQKGKLKIELPSTSSPDYWDEKLNELLNHGNGARFYLDKTLKTECKSVIDARRMKSLRHRRNILIYAVIPLGRAMLKQQLKGLHSDPEELFLEKKKKTPSKNSAVVSPPPPKENEDIKPFVKDVIPEEESFKTTIIEENVFRQKSPSTVVVVESDDDDDNELQVAAEEDSGLDSGNKSTEAACQIDVDDAEESHEMEQLIQLQEKLIERQRLAEARQDKKSGVLLKYIIVFYVARDKKGYLVPTYDCDKITDVYDRIVCQIPPEILAPRFFLEAESGERIGLNWKGDVGTLSHVKLIEMTHDMNDTITNLDEVLW